MSYACPTCGRPTEGRRPEVTNIAGGVSVGLMYLLFAPFFSKQFCPEHGKLEASDFPSWERRRLMLFPYIWLVGVVVLLGLLGWLVTDWLNSKPE